MISETLSEIGLSPSESKIYLSLVTGGPSPATDISKETGIHRANVYSTLHRLSRKGLVTSSKLDRHVLFSANDPDMLLAMLKEKEDSLRLIIPQLVMQSSLNDSLDIEVISGLSGTVNTLFSLQSLDGDFFFIGTDTDLPIGLSAKLSLLFSQSEIISKDLFSDVLIFFRSNIVLMIFPDKMQTLRIRSRGLVDVLTLLMRMR